MITCPEQHISVWLICWLLLYSSIHQEEIEKWCDNSVATDCRDIVTSGMGIDMMQMMQSTADKMLYFWAPVNIFLLSTSHSSSSYQLLVSGDRQAVLASE